MSRDECMWFVQQFDSFINLGICKEYPNMARPKSTSGSKASRTNTTITSEQTSTGSAANIPDVKAATPGITPAEVAADVKPAPASRQLAVVKTEPRKSVVVP